MFRWLSGRKKTNIKLRLTHRYRNSFYDRNIKHWISFSNKIRMRQRKQKQMQNTRRIRSNSLFKFHDDKRNTNGKLLRLRWLTFHCIQSNCLLLTSFPSLILIAHRFHRIIENDLRLNQMNVIAHEWFYACTRACGFFSFM